MAGTWEWKLAQAALGALGRSRWSNSGSALGIYLLREWGLFEAIQGYHIFALSVLLFIAQLEVPPMEAMAAESWAFIQLLPGPRDWIKPEVAHHLDVWGFPTTFRSLEHAAAAARARLLRYEDAAAGGLHARRRSRSLEQLMKRTTFIEREWRWSAWFRRSFPQVLIDTSRDLLERGLSPEAIEDLILGAPPRPHQAAQEARVRRSFQRRLSVELQTRARPHLEVQLRVVVDRWQPPMLPQVAVSRLQVLLTRLRHLVPPCVQAAYLRSLFNGWITDRRYGRRGPCRFDCHDGEDSFPALCMLPSCPTLRSVQITDR